jgi:hypothetical protein
MCYFIVKITIKVSEASIELAVKYKNFILNVKTELLQNPVILSGSIVLFYLTDYLQFEGYL